MAFQRVANVGEYRMIYQLHGQVCENVLHIQHAIAPSAADLNTMVTALENWHALRAKPVQSINAALRTIAARSLDTVEAPATERGITANGEGGNVEAATPASVTLAIKLTTGLSGRSARGRVYHIGIPQGAVIGNEVTLGYRDQLLTVYGFLISDVAAAGGTLVVVSRYSGKGADGKALKRAMGRALAVTGVSGDIAIDSQRRRLNGRGI